MVSFLITMSTSQVTAIHKMPLKIEFFFSHIFYLLHSCILSMTLSEKPMFLTKVLLYNPHWKSISAVSFLREKKDTIEIMIDLVSFFSLCSMFITDCREMPMILEKSSCVSFKAFLNWGRVSHIKSIHSIIPSLSILHLQSNPMLV